MEKNSDLKFVENIILDNVLKPSDYTSNFNSLINNFYNDVATIVFKDDKDAMKTVINEILSKKRCEIDNVEESHKLICSNIIAIHIKNKIDKYLAENNENIFGLADLTLDDINQIIILYFSRCNYNYSNSDHFNLKIDFNKDYFLNYCNKFSKIEVRSNNTVWINCNSLSNILFNIAYTFDDINFDFINYLKSIKKFYNKLNDILNEIKLEFNIELTE